MPVAGARLRNVLLIVALLLVPATLAGCITKRPTLNVALVAGSRGVLDEFATVDITITRVYVQQGGRDPVFHDIEPVTLDLLSLTNGRAKPFFSTPLDPDSYEKVGVVAAVSATNLQGSRETVVVVNNLLFAVIAFNLAKGEEDTFTLALTIKKRNVEAGGYALVAEQSESKFG